MFLADSLTQSIPPVPMEIAAWIACLLFIIMLFNACSKAWFTLRGKPSPIETQQATSDLSSRIGKIEECVSTCKENQNRRIEAIEKEQKELSLKLSREIILVFNRVNTVADLSSTMNGELNIIKSQLNMLLSTNRGRRN